MKTKLTLRLDDTLVKRAKAYAKVRGCSLSEVVSTYFALIEKPESREADSLDLSPSVRSLLGCIKGADVDEEDYKRHLQERYG